MRHFSDGFLASVCEGSTEDLINEVAAVIDEAARTDAHWAEGNLETAKGRQDSSHDAQCDGPRAARRRASPGAVQQAPTTTDLMRQREESAEEAAGVAEAGKSPVLRNRRHAKEAEAPSCEKEHETQSRSSGMWWAPWSAPAGQHQLFPYQSIVHRSIKTLFKSADVNGDGVIDVDEAYVLILLMYGGLHQFF